MKKLKTLISAFVLFALLTSNIFSQEIGFNTTFSSPIERTQNIQKEINKLKFENLASCVMTLGGVAAIGVGAVGTHMGYSLLETVINEDNGIADVFGLLIGTEFLAIGLVSLPLGLIVTSVCVDNIRNNRKILGEMKFVLTDYKSLSYKTKPGMGIGLSIALNSQ